MDIQKQLQIFRLLGIHSNVGKENKYCSPFRPDQSANCYITDYKGTLTHTDWGDSTYHGKSCIQCYMIKKGISDKLQAINLINKELDLGYFISKPIESKPKQVESKKEITPLFKKIDQEFKDYWALRGVTDFNNMKQVKAIKISADSYESVINKKELSIYYEFGTEWKIYTPFAKDKRYKWVGTVKKHNCWKHLVGSDTVLICKASKDFKGIQSILKGNSLLVDLYHLQGENLPNTSPTFPNRTELLKYKKIYTLLDNDNAGIKASENSAKVINSIPLYVPKIECTEHCKGYTKDFDELILTMGIDFATNWLVENLELTYF